MPSRCIFFLRPQRLVDIVVANDDLHAKSLRFSVEEFGSGKCHTRPAQGPNPGVINKSAANCQSVGSWFRRRLRLLLTRGVRLILRSGR